MREELWCLYILKIFQERDQLVPEKLLKILISSLMGEEIESNEFRGLITHLLERGFIFQEKNNLSLTPIGTSIIETLEDSIPELERDFIREIAIEYISLEKEKRDEFLEKLKESIKNGKVSLGVRIVNLPDDELKNYITNSVLLTVEDIIKEFYKITLRCPFLKSISKPSDRYRVISKTKHYFKQILGYCITYPSDDDTIVLLSPIGVNGNVHTIENYTLEVIDVQKVELDTNTIYKLISDEILPEILKEKGFTKVPNNRYIDYNAPSNEKYTKLGVLKVFSGIKIKVDELSRTEYLLWIDPIYRFMFNLYDFIEYLKSSGKTPIEIEDYLKNTVKFVRVLPYDSLGEITKVWLDEKDMTKEKVENSEISFYEFWENRHCIKLIEKQPLIEVKLGEFLFKYPVQVVYIDKKVLEDEFSHILEELPVTALNPPERYDKTIEFIDRISCEVNKPFIKLKIHSVPLTLDFLMRKGYFKRVCYVSPPLLRFNKERQKKDKISDPRAVFKYGPYSKEKTVKVHSVVYPTHVSRDEVSNLINELRKAFQRHNFGKLIFDGRTFYTITDKLKVERIGNIVRHTPIAEDDQSIAIVILPKELSTQKYRLNFKTRFAKLRDIPTQIILEKTMDKMRDGEYGIIKNLVIQIYSKLLKEGEALWVLESPADGKERSMYVGLGFSQKPLEGKKANSFAALCDARGLQLKWKAIGAPFQGKYITQPWFESLLMYIKENLDDRIDRIVIYRRGDTYTSEVEVMHSVITKSEFWSKKDMNFISVKDDIRRLYLKDEKISNVPLGLFVILNDKEVLCYNSYQQSIELKQGTIIPVKLKLEMGSTPIVDIVREYYDLCYLNWSSPITTSKYPLILNIANTIADMVKELPDENIFKWLPL